tara:strand:- start:11 stop:583 length:573 start_codon:yes stop_codon:yes gene_type:complete
MLNKAAIVTAFLGSASLVSAEGDTHGELPGEYKAPQLCAAETTAKLLPISHYLECAAGELTADRYFYGAVTLSEDVYNGLLQTCMDTRMHDDDGYCRTIFPQNRAPFTPGKEVSSDVSYLKSEQCRAGLFPYATTSVFMQCAIGVEGEKAYMHGDLRLSSSAHEQVIGHCMELLSEGDCYEKFPIEKIFE